MEHLGLFRICFHSCGPSAKRICHASVYSLEECGIALRERPYLSVVQHTAQHESREQPSLQLPSNSVAFPDTIKVSKHCPRYRCASSDFALSCCVCCQHATQVYEFRAHRGVHPAARHHLDHVRALGFTLAAPLHALYPLVVSHGQVFLGHVASLHCRFSLPITQTERSPAWKPSPHMIIEALCTCHRHVALRTASFAMPRSVFDTS